MCRNLTTRGLDSDNLKRILFSKKQLCNRLKSTCFKKFKQSKEMDIVKYKTLKNKQN